MKILVTGATGTVGGHVASQLSGKGHEVVALVRNPAKAELPADIIPITGDLTDAAAVRTALQGVDHAFLNMADDNGAVFTEVAAEIGLGHVVLLSSFTAVTELPSGADNIITVRHRAGEQALIASGVPATFLRSAGFDMSAARVAAVAQLPGLDGVLGNAEVLPLADNEFEVTTARHVLDCVPDPTRALREFRRITRPGGRVAVAVDHPTTCARTRQLVCDQASEHGLAPVADMVDTVHSGTLPTLMSAIFDDIRIHQFDNVLAFDTPAPLIRYAEALFSFCGIDTENPHRAEILDAVSTDIHDWFRTHPGRPGAIPRAISSPPQSSDNPAPKDIRPGETSRHRRRRIHRIGRRPPTRRRGPRRGHRRQPIHRSSRQLAPPRLCPIMSARPASIPRAIVGEKRASEISAM